MATLLLRIRFLLWLLRSALVPLAVFLILLFVVLTVALSFFLLLLFKTIGSIPDNPYLYVPLLILELALALLLLYGGVVYTNRIRKRILKNWR